MGKPVEARMSTEEARRYQEISDLLLELAERFPAEPSKRLLLSMARDYKEQADYLVTNDAGRCPPLVPAPLAPTPLGPAASGGA